MRELPSRPRLESRLDGALVHRLTLLVADAGFGKSTLLATWSAGIPAVMHRFTTADRDLTQLWRRLVETFRRHLADLPEVEAGSAAAVRGPLSAHGDTVRAQAMAELLGHALTERLTRDLVLVLDDAHLVPEGPAAQLVAGLVRHAPPLLHVVLSSRGPVPVPAARLRTQGQVLEVTGAELAFTSEEVAALLAAVLGPEPGDPGLAEAVRAATGGWPIAVRLAVEGLRGLPPAERAGRAAELALPGGSWPHDQLTGLVRAAYQREPAPVRRLLAVGALFDRFTAELCAALGVPDASGTVAGLVRRGLFVEPAPEDRQLPAPAGGAGVGDWFRLHPLARQFVAAEAPLPPDEVERLHQAAADWFVPHGLSQVALRSLVAVGDHDRVRQLLGAAGEQLAISGHADVVVDAVESLPASGRPAQLEQVAGHAYLLRGEWDEALARYRRAGGDGPLPDALAWRTGMVHYLRGEHQRALDALRRVAAPPEPGDGVDGDRDRSGGRDWALVLAWAAAVHWVRGDPGTCGELAARALRAATAADDPAALAAAHTVLSMRAAWEGDRRANAAHYARALEYAQQAGDVLQLIRIRGNRASHSMEEGDYPAALEELEVAVRLADLYGYGAFGGLALTNRGELRLRLGRLEEAHRDLTAALAIFDDLGSRMAAYPLRLLGQLRQLRGDRGGAGRAYRQVLALVEQSGDLQATVPALAGLARLAVDGGAAPPDGDEGDGDPAELVARALGYGEGLGYVAALLAAARVAAAQGDRAAALRHAQAAQAAAQARRDRAGLAEAWEIEATVTEDAARARELAGRSAALWAEIGDPVGRAAAELAYADRLDDAAARAAAASVRRQMDEIGCRWMSAQAEVVAARHAGPEPATGSPPEPAARPVGILTLGAFRLIRDGKPVPASTWKSRKARDVLKILVARRGRPVTRDQLLDILWPDEPPSAAAVVANRLHVAVSTLRTVLDPERRFAADTFVASDGDAVRVRLENVEVDVEAFLTDATAGAALLRTGRRDEALPRLTRAESRYAGDFLEEDLYADWAVPLREQARAAYLTVASRLAEQSEASGDTDGVTRYLLRMLELDPYDEHAHLRLVATCAATGRHGDARRHYRHYCARMEELEVEAAPFPAQARSGRSAGRA